MDKCKQCNLNTVNTNKNLFCSRTCYYQSRVGILKSHIYRNCIICNKEFRIKPAQFKVKTRKNLHCSLVCSNKSRRGVKKSQDFIDKCRKASYWKGKKLDEKHRRKISETRKIRISLKQIIPMRGKNHANWLGGLQRRNKRIRNLKSMKEWRIKVFERDNYTCQECGIRNQQGLGKTIKLQADHIKPFALYPKLRRVLYNGRTLCEDCHRKTDTFGRQKMYLTKKHEIVY